MIDVIMPKMGESITEGTILEWKKVVGDNIQKDETLLEISTDKVDSEVPSPGSGKIIEILYNVNDVVAVATKESDFDLLDIRSAAEYSGKIFAPEGVPELSVRAGHIPGAINVSWGKAVNEDGTIKTVSELKQIYAAAGIDGSKPIITYCRIGERSSHSWFVLKKILGYDAINYDGSWTEYGNSVGNPITNLSGTIWGKT